MDPITSGVATRLSSEVAKGTFQKVKRHTRYVTSYQKYVEKFEEKMKSLIAKRESVQKEIDAAERNVEKIKPDVVLWCGRADKTIDEEVRKVKDLKDKAKSNIKSRYKLSRKAEKGAIAVDDLIGQCQFNGVGYRDVPEARVAAPPKGFEAFKSREEVFNDIMEALRDPNLNTIGVFGMGGVGKTTLVNDVAIKVKEVKLFGSVVKATVTRIPNIEKIQDEIAESLSLKLEEKSVAQRARLLLERLKKEKNILLVLDDLWARLALEEVGIPCEDQHKGCKILLTSRNQNVLTNEMDAQKTFAVHVLEENEAWELFQKMVGNDFDDPELRSVATKVARECAGLPLAIVTVARALRNRAVHAWKDASLQLQRPSPSNFTGIPAAVYSAIELSYSQLESEDLKQTFLLCSLLGHNAQVQDLLRYTMGLHLFENVNTVEETRNRVLTIVSNLKASCLLRDSYSDERFDMHDLVCDVALAIASRENHVFASKDEGVFENWPDEERMRELKMISLSFASVKKLPPQLECPQLTFFFMGSEGSVVEMPTNFFEKVENIRVLHLIKTGFSSLPSSISLPTSLRTMCLNECVLGDMVNFGKLKNLEILDLSRSYIDMLPEEIGQLTELRVLDLRGSKLIIVRGVLSSLTRLEELYIGDSFVQWNQESNAHLDELKNLSCLTTLEVKIIYANIVPKDLLFSENLQRYKIIISNFAEHWVDINDYSRILKVDTSVDRLDDGLKSLLKKTEALSLTDIKGVKIVSNEVGNREGFLQLKYLDIQDALGIRYIVNDNDASGKIAFHQLRVLALANLPRLIGFCSENRSGSTSTSRHELPLFGIQMEFPCLEKLFLVSVNVERIWHNQFQCPKNLTSLFIAGCHNLRSLLSPSMARSLAHLESLEISRCKCLREIIFTEDIEEEINDPISFPQLNSLKMQHLENLMGFCSESYTIELPSLMTLTIELCPKLKGFMYKSPVEENQIVYLQAFFDEKVAFPCLEQLRIVGMGECRKIWHDPLIIGDSFCKLKVLDVFSCSELLNIFPFNMRERLQNLEYLSINYCDLLEEIFEPQVLRANELHAVSTQSVVEVTTTNFLFPKLTYLELSELPKLKSFYSRTHTTEWPSLQKMFVEGCHKMEIFASKSLSLKESTSQEPLFLVNEVKFPNLEELILRGNEVLIEIWHGELQGFGGNENDALAPTSSNKSRMSQLPEPTHLWKEEYCPTQAFCKLRMFEVRGCNKLKNLVPSSVSFENLTKLVVYKCHRLVNLVAYSTAKSLAQLRRMVINDCGTIAEIIASEGDEVIGGIVFMHLEYLCLCNLPSLANFCSGDHIFEFPAMKEMIVTKCPMLNIFWQGVQEVILTEDGDIFDVPALEKIL